MIPDSVLRSFRNRRVVVTGGTGLIGRQVVCRLCEAGAHVHSVSLDRLEVHPAAEHVYGDLTSFEFCKSVTQCAHDVFQVAGIKGSLEVTLQKPASFFVPLLMMNTNMLEACRVNGVERVLYTSSIGAYPSGEFFRESEELEESPPMDRFPGWAKRMGEMQIRAYKIQFGLQNFSVVRPANVYGPGDQFDPKNAMVIPSLMARIRAGEDPLVVWGDGSAVRDFAYSEDLADGLLLALYHGTRGRCVNLGGGRGYSIREVVEALNQFIPFSYRFDDSKPAGFPRRVMDISLARELLGYEPATTLAEGLRKTWEWFVQNQDEHLKKVNYFRATVGS